MEISREYALKELRAIRAVIDEWISELDDPRTPDGPVFPDGVPESISVAQLGLPVPQLRAELAGCAGRIEALITAG